MSQTTHAFQYGEYGNPDVLTWDEVPLNEPTSDEVQIRHTAVGVNFLDIYQRKGADRSLAFPARIGVEAVGRIEAVGDAQTRFASGDRVAYVGGAPGSYSLGRNISAGRVIKLPDWIEDDLAAALMFKGITVEYLINRCVAVNQNQTVLFHAAAGGVGSLACQWLHAKGATVIGTVGSEEKIEQALANGCDHVLLSDDPEFVTKLRDLTGGVDVVFDSIGQATFTNSLDSLRPRGTMVSFGAASGAPRELDVSDLVSRGSLFLTRPSIAHYTSDPEEFQIAADTLFKAVQDGAIRQPQITRLPIREARQAHTLMEARKTTGSLVLMP
ncbi:quinone oxidoreductase family protein [Ruegeria meonggei]|uniref:Quinone oxidoreductase 1 n=1 Tax=Ruegeria meonggei TaxID=1446476 RepID=A0A1X6YWX0_9RHOB|nr:quinone oxidoreductase [Ruegeria meonggei]SLN33652.1 Quinone oxidoreductase 1 [Ruegeria meonggei]